MKRDRTKTGLIGAKFGSLTVVAWAHGGKSSFWRVKCECGRESVKQRSNLTKFQVRGCGFACPITRKHLATSSTHRMTRHPLYSAWKALKYRCTRPKCHAWKDYGGRGITVCARWSESFENFLADMGKSWAPGLTVDRINNDAGYEPSNCRWVPQSANCWNRRGAIVSPAQREYAYSLGIRVATLGARIRSGWGVEKAISTPARPKRKNTK
jgi:hypothetical protein